MSKYEEQQIYTLKFLGEIIPYVRMTAKSTWTPRAQKYLKQKGRINKEAKEQVKKQGLRELLQGSIYLGCDFYISKRFNVKDVDNLAKAIADALQGVVYVNDRQVTNLWATKKTHDADICFCKVRGIVDGKAKSLK